LGTIAPDDPVRLAELGHFFNPFEKGLVVGHMTSPFKKKPVKGWQYYNKIYFIGRIR